MSYSGEERRIIEKVERLEHEVLGNGKPGLLSRMIRVEQAIYGDEQNHQKGMLAKQDEILKFVYAVRPFLNPKILIAMFSLSIFACLKVLGADLIGEVLKKLVI